MREKKIWFSEDACPGVDYDRVGVGLGRSMAA
jgi:hypothetical protein